MVKIVKKKELPPVKQTIQRVLSVLIALVCSALFIALLGFNPVTVYVNLVSGALGTLYRFQETINKTIPLVVLSLGIAVSFKMKFNNIGAEGQFYLGAMAATLVGLNFPTLPAYILLPLMFLAGAIAGGLWCLFPALLKTRWGTSETLVTLMLNYVAVKWVTYLQVGPWKDPAAKGFPKIAKFTDNAVLPKVFGIHCGWIIALLLVVVVYILINRSKLGYEISVMGENPTTAQYAGMNTKKILYLAVLLSGALCGVAGMMQSSAIERSLSDQMSGGMGFTAIITAWLAQLSAPVIVFVSFFFAILLQGSAYIQSSLQIPSAVADVIQGMILFFVLGSEFFTQYKFVRTKEHKEVA